MLKQVLGRITKCRGEDEVRGRFTYTEEKVDILIEKLSAKLEKLEGDLRNIKTEYECMRQMLKMLYEHNIKLVRKYDGQKGRKKPRSKD